MKVHPTTLRKNGKNEFVILPYEEYLALQERLADAEDVLTLRRAKAKERKAPTRSLTEVKKELGID